MKKYRLKIGLDVDDTIYKCNSYALSILKEQYGDLPELDINRIKSWGKQNTLADERLSLFTDPEFVRQQPLIEGAKAFVHKLSQIADVFFITAVPPACMSARAMRLSEDFPEIPETNIIIGTRKDVINLDILLDDGAHNISTSQATYPVLLRQPWNAHLTGLLAVNSYRDFLQLVNIIRKSFSEKGPDLSAGGVICLVGPSGSGKSELAQSFVKDPRFVKPITTTTRPKKPDESDNAYRFVSEEQFMKDKKENKFFETTVYSHYYFGTTLSDIDTIVQQTKIAVIPIDICGALTMKSQYHHQTLLVYTDKQKESLIRNIISRPIQDEDKIRRILSLDYEMKNSELCDIIVDCEEDMETCKSAILAIGNIQ